jgi:antitoxin (DNA-binding transcriptional repressor) of toxin-antitoxin stability system
MSKFKKIAANLDLSEPLTITYKGEPVMVIKPYQDHLKDIEFMASIASQVENPRIVDPAN